MIFFDLTRIVFFILIIINLLVRVGLTFVDPSSFHVLNQWLLFCTVAYAVVGLPADIIRWIKD
jgi:hypothetical protein